jgi:hypothetical protein
MHTLPSKTFLSIDTIMQRKKRFPIPEKKIHGITETWPCMFELQFSAQFMAPQPAE